MKILLITAALFITYNVLAETNLCVNVVFTNIPKALYIPSPASTNVYSSAYAIEHGIVSNIWLK